MSQPDFLPFALPEIDDDDIAEVVDSLRSGWVTTGPKARRFEEAFAAFLSGEPGDRPDADATRPVQAVAVNSATAGLHLALEALGIGPGDEVITTTHTFASTAEVVRYVGADVRLVDVDVRTLNIDPELVERAITPATRAIIPVHYAGLAADMDRLLALASRHRLHVVEDAAHALPASWRGRRVGTLASNACVFSFYANKTMTTGEGGMLVTRDPALAQRARTMRLHGMSRDAFDRYTSKVPSWYYEVVAPGFKYNLTDIAAALGLQQLNKLRRFHARRAVIAARYARAFADLPLVLPPDARPGDEHAWHLYPVRLADEAPVNRDTLVQALFDQGVGCSVHYIPLHLQPYWRDRYALTPAMFPVSQHAYERLVSLPIYSRMSDADIERVVHAVRGALR